MPPDRAGGRLDRSSRLNEGKTWAVLRERPKANMDHRRRPGQLRRPSSVDGKWYAYFGGITYERGHRGTDDGYLRNLHPNLYEVDLFQTGRAHLLAPRTDCADIATWLVGPDGKVSAIMDSSALVAAPGRSRNPAWPAPGSAAGRTNPIEGRDQSMIGFGSTPGTRSSIPTRATTTARRTGTRSRSRAARRRGDP